MLKPAYQKPVLEKLSVAETEANKRDRNNERVRPNGNHVGTPSGDESGSDS